MNDQQRIQTQKTIEDFLTLIGLEPIDEWEKMGIIYTQYEKDGIAVTIERKIEYA